MQNKTRTYQQKAGLQLFTLGLLLSSIIALIAIWGDLEASLFDVSIRPQESLSTLRCPILITEKESGTIRASFKNESEKSVEISVRAHVSQGFVTYLREENTRLPISAGGTESLSWSIDSEDAAFNRVVLARIATLRKPGHPSVGAACGVMVWHTNLLTGQQIIIGTLLLSFVCLVASVYLWGYKRRVMTSREHEITRMMALFAGIILLALIAGFIGWWGLGVVAFIFVLLLLGSTFEHFIHKS
ncbi:MAG: hypothetical protein GY805_23090 [Chloroflexi bacterium]|nr:hypothetical protein [Chloroflexota bacterium]